MMHLQICIQNIDMIDIIDYEISINYFKIDKFKCNNLCIMHGRANLLN